jgi:hypothetical protein
VEKGLFGLLTWTGGTMAGPGTTRAIAGWTSAAALPSSLVTPSSSSMPVTDGQPSLNGSRTFRYFHRKYICPASLWLDYAPKGKCVEKSATLSDDL